AAETVLCARIRRGPPRPGSPWRSSHGVGLLNDTWEFLPPQAATWTRNGAGCAISAGIPLLDCAPGSLPGLGTTFTMQLTGLPTQPGIALLVIAPDSALWNGTPLPVSLAPFGLPQCSASVDPTAAISWLLPNAGGATTVSLAIPPNPGLAGTVLATQ